MRKYFVARLPLELCDELHKELLEGRIRFGWGAKGLDLRNGKENFIASCREHFGGQTKAEHLYWVLSVLTRIHAGDIILLPKVSVDQSEVGNYFTVAECTAEYSFAPLPNNDFGHIIGVKLLGTFDYGAVDSKINKAFRYRAINRVNKAETIQEIEKLLCSLSLPENDLDSLMDKMLSMQENYLESLLKILKNLPPDAPTRKEYSRKVLEMLRTFFPDTLKKIVKELFITNGYRLIGEDLGFTFEKFSERELMHDFYTPETIPKVFVCVKSFGTGYEEIYRQFEDKGHYDMCILIDLVEKFDESTLKAAEALDLILIDGLTFASILARRKS